MYRCTGRQWTEWGWGATGNGLHYTALLRDSASEPPAAAAETGPDEDEDKDDDVIGVTSENDDVNTETMQETGRGRRRSCRQG